MWKYLRYVRGKLDRSKNSVWGRKASIGYALGTWTLLGIFFIKWKQNHFELPQLPAMPEEEKAELIAQLRLEQKKKSEEICLHVAENVYTPLDFMS